MIILWNILLCYKKVKFATIIDGDMKAPFSIATTPTREKSRSLSYTDV